MFHYLYFYITQFYDSSVIQIIKKKKISNINNLFLFLPPFITDPLIALDSVRRLREIKNGNKNKFEEGMIPHK